MIKEAAREIGVDPGTCSKWERGQIILYRQHRVFIAQLLGLSVDALNKEMASRWNWSHERALRVPILVFPQELGHNLFLFHGGNEDCNYKPNYNSVMNYACQFSGIDNNCTPPGNGVLNYSSGNRIDLDENNGTCGNAHTTLLDFNDWDNLQFGGWSNADGAMLIQVPQRIITEQPVPAECTN